MQEKKGSEHTSLQLSQEGHLKVTLCQYAQEVICIEIPNHLVNLNFFYLFLAQEIKNSVIFLYFLIFYALSFRSKRAEKNQVHGLKISFAIVSLAASKPLNCWNIQNVSFKTVK